MSHPFLRWSLLSAILLGACYGGEPSPEATPPPSGEHLVQQLGCASCHSGGAGPFAGQGLPRPGSSAYGTNLTPDEATGLGTWSEDEIVRALRDGVDREGAPLCPTMPRFALVDGDAHAVVAYLRTLPARENEVPESVCPPIKSPDEPPPEDLDAGKKGADCTLVAPSQRSACHACGDAHPCQPNGCFNGWWCNGALRRCVPKPDNCTDPG